MIYVLHAPEVHRVKIGYTGTDVMTRLSMLQGQCPVHLNLLAVIEGDRERERLFHQAFASHRCRLRRSWNADSGKTSEWFDDCILSVLMPMITHSGD